MKNTYLSLVTLSALAAGCQVGEVTEVGEPVAVPVVLDGFDGGREERLVGELFGDELRLSPDLVAALGESYDVRLIAGGVDVSLDPDDPVARLSRPLAADEPIRLTLTDDLGPVASLDLRLGDPAEAAEHDDDLIYYHTCPSGSGSWSLYDSRFAISGCGTCGAGKRSWVHRVMVCHSCSNGSTACSVAHYSEYCDYC